MRRPTALPLALVALVFPAAAQAVPKEEVAESGGVRAVFRYDCRGTVSCRDLSITISRGGAVVYQERLVPPRGLVYVPGRPLEKSVEVRDLDGDPEPEVLLDLYTGGAHCCLLSRVYDYDGSRYLRIRRNWGDPGYVLRDLDRDGRPEFRSADRRFSFLYTSYAESRFPLQIWRFEGGRFADVTRTFRRLVRRDRDAHLRAVGTLRRLRADVRGALAAYQADNYLLGRATARRGWRVLRRLAREGKIRRPRFATGPSGQAYLRSLRRVLRRFGYAG